LRSCRSARRDRSGADSDAPRSGRARHGVGHPPAWIAGGNHRWPRPPRRSRSRWSGPRGRPIRLPGLDPAQLPLPAHRGRGLRAHRSLVHLPARGDSLGETSRTRMRERFLAPTVGAVVLWGVVVGVASIAAALGTSSTNTLVTQMLIDAIVVVGLQVFIGNTGMLSFGHPAFGAYAGYVVALLTMPVSRKLIQIPDVRWGLAEAEVDPTFAIFAAVAVTLVVGAIFGLALVRSGASSGAVSATMFTL